MEDSMESTMQCAAELESSPAGSGVQIGFALPLNSESRWSDMLAVLISTDAGPMCRVLGLDVDPEQVVVHRELTLNAANRPDLVLKLAGKPLAVLEAKVMAGIGPQQLERYYDAEPNANAYALVFPESFVVDVEDTPPWRGISWERILEAYFTSGNEWAALAAKSWLDHIAARLPRLGPDAIWNGLVEGEGFVVAMRARMSWLFGQLGRDVRISTGLRGSSAGVSWILSLWAETAVPGYRIKVEIEENLPVRRYPAIHRGANRHKALGPSAKVMLWQGGVTSSAGFDWNHLEALWPSMAAARDDWVRNSPNPKAGHEKAGIARIRASGVPKWVGIGFGEAQTRISGSCMFGARIQFPSDITLGQMSKEITRLSDLTKQLAEVQYKPAD
jgi:hypothetical protein